MTLVLVGILFAILSVVGTPLFTIVAAIALLAFHLAGIDTAAVMVELYRLAQFPGIIAIPLFTFAGYVLAESGAPKRLIAFVQSLFGWIPGGLAIVTVISTAVFTAFTGASGVTIIALGGLLYPALLKQGYPQKFSLGLMTTSGSLGLLFPPSLPIILYGLIAGLSIETLFLAGLLPGILILIILAVYSVRVGTRAKVERIPFSWKNVAETFRGAIWELPLPVLVVAGIYGGLFTATEASAITAFYAVLVEVVILKDLRLVRDMPRVIRESMLLVGAILVMLGAAIGLTNYMIDQDVPARLFAWMNTFVSNKYTFLVVLNCILLGVNMLEIYSAIVIIVPIIIPLAHEYAVDPIHLAIIFLLNLEIGYMIPPLALNIFLASFRFKVPLPVIYRAVLPFLVLLISLLMIITYVPELSLAMVHWFGK